MIAIKVSRLTKRFGATTALHDVSFSLAPGVAFGLLGPNGSGKSTLLRLLATLDRPTAGRVLIAGHDVAVAPRAARRSLGFVPDEFHPYRGLSVVEHLDFFARCFGLSRRERLAAVDTMLQLVDLSALGDASAVTLSRGQRQRLALATAMVHNPDVLLLDEPLAGLDAPGRVEMLEVLKELRAMGKTIVLSSHALEDVSRLCDAIGLLHKGRLLASGPLAEVLADDPLPERQVSVDVVEGMEIARTVLLQMPEARELDAGDSRITFAYAGKPGALPNVLERLVRAGVQISEFTTRGRPVDDALARTLRELEE